MLVLSETEQVDYSFMEHFHQGLGGHCIGCVARRLKGPGRVGCRPVNSSLPCDLPRANLWGCNSVALNEKHTQGLSWMKSITQQHELEQTCTPSPQVHHDLQKPVRIKASALGLGKRPSAPVALVGEFKQHAAGDREKIKLQYMCMGSSRTHGKFQRR